MPAKSKKQQRLMGAELRRRRQGKKPRLKGMSTAEVRKMARKKRRG